MNPAFHDKFESDVKEAIRNAKLLGTKVVLVTVGGLRYDMTQEQQLENVAIAGRRVAPLLEDAGIDEELETSELLDGSVSSSPLEEDPPWRALDEEYFDVEESRPDEFERVQPQVPFPSWSQTNDAPFSSTKTSMPFSDSSQVNCLSSSIVESSMGVFALVKFSLSDSLQAVKRSPPAMSVIAIFFMG